VKPFYDWTIAEVEGGWLLTRDGTRLGPYPTRHEALKAAVEMENRRLIGREPKEVWYT